MYNMDLGVKDIYEEIAFEFDETRQSVWRCVKEFMGGLEPGMCGLDIGCGNGKNMLYRKDVLMEGGDFCDNFVKICRKKNLKVKQNDMRELKYKNDVFDFSLSIAVLHHLYNKDDRLKALRENIRILKTNGIGLILVWAKRQDKDSRVTFTKSDEMVPWQRKTGEYVYRYYHIYDKDELESEINNFKNIKIIHSFYEKGNYGIIFKKI